MDGRCVLTAADLSHADVAVTANVRGDLDAAVEAELGGRRYARIVVRESKKQRVQLRRAGGGPGRKSLEHWAYLIVRADVSDERNAEWRDRLDTTDVPALFDHARGPTSALAFAKHTGRAAETFAKGAREGALTTVPRLAPDIDDSTIARGQLTRRALEPQSPHVLGGWLSNDRSEQPMKVKRRETRMIGELG